MLVLRLIKPQYLISASTKLLSSSFPPFFGFRLFGGRQIFGSSQIPIQTFLKPKMAQKQIT